MEPERHRRMLRRVEQVGHVRFLTFSCHRRLALLDHDGIRELFLARLAKVCESEHVRLLAWVLMPEHVHLLVFPDAEPDIQRFSHTLKRPVAEAVLRRWKELDAPILKRIAHGTGYRFWQTGGGYDRNLFNPDAVREKIQYMHDNPVRRETVAAATDYPWSSVRRTAGCEAAVWRTAVVRRDVGDGVPQVAVLRDLCLFGDRRAQVSEYRDLRHPAIPQRRNRGDFMSLQSRAQLENTRAKLKLLEGRLGELEQEPVVNARTRELTRLSLKKLINQLKEEIVRFEARGFGQSVIHSATHQEVTLQEGLPRD